VPQTFNNTRQSNPNTSLKSRMVPNTAVRTGAMPSSGVRQPIGNNSRADTGNNGQRGRGQFTVQESQKNARNNPRDFTFNTSSKIMPELGSNGRHMADNPDPYDEEKLFESMKIEGTSRELEKPFYRLTEIPEPSEVRPEPILKQAMQHILDKHKAGACSVHFVLDQFKSIRLV
jgi:hypothetical protein